MNINTDAKQRRIALREWRERDAPALFALASDSIVAESAGFPVHNDLVESIRVIREVFCKPESYAVVSASDGMLLGCINLCPVRKEESVYESEAVKIGYWLGRPFWGRGLMLEAVGLLCERCRTSNEFRCVKILGYAKVDNVRSRRVLEKAGFNFAGANNGDCRYEKILA